MKKYFYGFLLVIILFTSCVSKTIIDSVPNQAKVYIDGQYVGETPYKHSDKEIAGTSKHIELVKEGYKDKKIILARDSLAVGPLVGGIIGTLFFPFVGWLPFLWVQEYDAYNKYELSK